METYRDEGERDDREHPREETNIPSRESNKHNSTEGETSKD